MIELAIFDIDGTIRKEASPWASIHRRLGVYDKAKGFFQRYEEHRITFEELISLDVSLWKGVDYETLFEIGRLLPLNSEIKNIFDWIDSRNIPKVAITSGVDVINQFLIYDYGFKFVFANTLKFDNKLCLGEVDVVVTENNKGDWFDKVCHEMRVSNEMTIVFGDGVADIPMLIKSGLGVAFNPKNNLVIEASDYILNNTEIDRCIEKLNEHERGLNR